MRYCKAQTIHRDVIFMPFPGRERELSGGRRASLPSAPERRKEVRIVRASLSVHPCIRARACIAVESWVRAGSGSEVIEARGNGSISPPGQTGFAGGPVRHAEVLQYVSPKDGLAPRSNGHHGHDGVLVLRHVPTRSCLLWYTTDAAGQDQAAS